MAPKITPQQEICSLLHKALQRLRADNSRFSIRSLALKVGMSSSYLSKVIRGEKPLNVSLVKKLSAPLALDRIEIQTLHRCLLELETHDLDHSGELLSGTLKKNAAAEYKTFAKRDYILLEKWYYIPLLNLVTLPGFQDDPQWISKKLGVPFSEVKDTLKMMVHAGYLEIKDGFLRTGQLKARFPTHRSHEAIRKHHIHMLKKAENKLLTKVSQEDFEERLINGISFAGDSRRLAQAQSILNQALYEVAELMSSGEPDHIYQMNLQLFKVTE